MSDSGGTGADEVDFVHRGIENNRRRHADRDESHEMTLLRDGRSVDSESEEASQWEEQDLLDQSARVVLVYAPVSICMIVVVCIVNLISFYRQHTVALIYTPFKEDKADGAGNFLSALYNALIVIAVVAVLTFTLVMLYKFRCTKIIQGWLFFSSLIMLFFFTYTFFLEFLKNLNVPADLVTMALFIWNFGFIGMLSLYYKAPLRVQQFYLIVISSLMALTFIKYLPPWTTWTILALMACWDLIAVLTPCGPLKMLVETARKRDEPLFEALVYSTKATMVVLMANGNERNRSQQEREANSTGSGTPSGVNDTGSRQSEEFDEEEEEAAPRGPQLGLGDFIFYSLLVGRASSYADWNTTIACFIAILVGLGLTLLLLAAFSDRLKALPALPISIALGLVFYFGTRYVITPFTNLLAANQVYI